MAKFNPATATKTELETRIRDYSAKADSMVREDDDSPKAQAQIRNLRACVAALRAELATR